MNHYYENSDQSGSALIISLILIFVMSMVGMNSMRTASFGSRMTNNAVHKNTTLQSAESANELILSDTDNLQQAFQALDATNSHVPVVIDVELSDNSEMITNGSLKFAGTGPAIGNSLGSGGFVALQFESIGNSTIDSAQAASSIVQGAYRVVPSLD